MAGRQDNAGGTRLKQQLRALPHSPGVYLLKDRLGSILYVGKAKDLKKRVSTYFQPSRKLAIAQPKVAAMLDLIQDFSYIEVKSESEALLLEGRLIKQYKPKYNTDFTDNKQFLLVRVSMNSTLPRFRLTRNRREDAARYFGPFAHSGLLRKTLAEMRLKFGILLGDGKPEKLEDGRWQLYDDARADIYGQTEPVSQAEYRERVEQACEFLSGKAREWLGQLEEQMQTAAKKQDFERAAQLRDIIRAMRKTLNPARRFTGRGDPVRSLELGEADALDELVEHLKLAGRPVRMECFDISHISGSYVVASMVHFHDGKPDRAHYRRYKIRTFIGNDDYRAMTEVVGRRYARLHAEGSAMPDLIVIDGGIGQVRAALNAFAACEIEPPQLIGLAKREETIIFPDRDPLQLPQYAPALHLLQRLRDEAHRFANSFSDELRRQKIKESILMDMEGLGESRRKALLEHFGSLKNLKAATLEDLQTVEGIGPKLARRLLDFLRGQSLA